MTGPAVPRRSQGTVGTAPLPGVRTPVDVPGAAFRAPAGIDPTGISRDIAEVIDRHRQHADTVIMLDADNKLAELESSLRTNATKLKGKDALGATQQATDGWQQGVSDIESSLTSEQQREQFRLRAASRYIGLKSFTENHGADEWDRFQAQTTDTAIKNRMSDAIANYRDPQTVARNAVEARSIIQNAGRRNGWDTETTDRKVAESLSAIHAGVISRYLAAGDDLGAKEYYEKSKSQLLGEHRDNIEASLKEGSTRGESQRQADAITAKATDRASALEAVRKISDPGVRDATEERVNRFFSEKRQAETEDREDRYLTATNIVDKNPGRSPRDVVPPAIWTQLPPEQRNTLERRANAPDTNDAKRWLTFLDMTPQQLGALTKSEFESGYWSHFDPNTRSKAESMWASARDAFRAGKLDPKVHDALTFSQRVTDALRYSGMVPKDKPVSKWKDEQIDFAAEVRDEAAAQLESFESAKGKPAGADERQAIIDRLLIQKAFGSKRPAQTKLVVQDDNGNYRVPTARIPVDENEKLGKFLRARGFSISTSKVERLYAAQLLGASQQDWNAIAQEP
jgi:hypothetical protein